MPRSAAVIEAPERSLSLFQIEQEKAELIAFREECVTDEERTAVDRQIQEYVGAEIRKVSGIAALLKFFKSNAEAAKAEQDRVAKQRAKWEGRYERLKAMVLGVMQTLEIQKVESATDRLRRQKNPVSLEVYDVTQIPEKYLNATIRMPFSGWKRLLEAAGAYAPEDGFSVNSEVDSSAIKAELQKHVQCPACKGDPIDAAGGRLPTVVCEVCRGEKTVPASVPGARLTQGEHLRIE